MAHSMLEGTRGSQSSPQELASRTAAYSLPNSQDSSLNDSSTSQQSQIPQASSTEDIRIAHGTHHLHGTTTPSTSVSNKSSREVIGTAAPPVDQDILSSQEKRHPANPSVVRQPNHSISDLQHEHTSTPKRMANGEIKSPEYSLPTSPVGASQYGHSRDSSRTSKGSQISNLSSQMRTRLSYAMVKVQNGWQSHNLNELEFMTSDQASPASAFSDQRRPYDSLLANELSVDRSRIMQPTEGAIAPQQYDSVSAQKTSLPAGHQETLEHCRFSKRQPPPTQIGASYESFWREHEGSSVLKHPGGKSPSPGGPSLAPPVDIIPRNSRQADFADRQPPPLHTRGLHSAGSQTAPAFSTLPATPPPKRTPKLRTPSQQAAVEKDAVETLLFMSSPGNPAYHPPVILSGTPLRSGLAPRTSQSDHLGTTERQDGRSGGIDAFLRQTPRPKTQLSDAELNKMLDEMPETSSSDDDELQDQRPLQRSGGR